MERSVHKSLKRVANGPAAESVESAARAGLHFVHDGEPGIRRRRAGRGFAYIGPDGERIGETDLRRIRALAIPPAWTGVWICRSADGHLQAVGRDARGRKQYRYHPLYRKVRDERKFHHMLAFADALPALRRRVRSDLKRPGLPMEKVLALVVRLLETTSIRIGNGEYARSNQSYGLTTLRDRHVKISGPRIQIRFRGKSGGVHDLTLEDARLARIVRQCRDLPGYELFRYVEAEGESAVVTSGDVNDYIRRVTGGDFTAKDFRTWAGTMCAIEALEGKDRPRSDRQTQKTIREAVMIVSGRLRNRPATCRAYYIHPAVLDAYEAGLLRQVSNNRDPRPPETGLSVRERFMVALIRRVERSARKAA